MAGSSQGFNPSSSGRVPPSMGGNRGYGEMYRAFEDYERQARQRKYMIAELEDTIENLEKQLKEVVEKNKAKEVECEKLEIAAQAAESNYEKKVKEKALMENNFRALSKEMDEVAMEIAKKKTQLNQAHLFHQQKIEQIRKTEEQYTKEYMKYPKCAFVLEINAKIAKLDETLKEKHRQLERRKGEQKELRQKYNEEWQVFQKKCIRLAEIHVELRKKIAARDALKADYDSKFRTPKTADIRRVKMMTQQLQESQSPPSSSSRPTVVPVMPVPSIPRRMDGVGLAFPRQRRSSTFQQLDNLLSQSNSIAGSLAERRASFKATSEAGSSTWKNYCSPMRTGSTLVSQIRSKLKGTVHPMPRVHPMPQRQEAKEGSNLTSGQVASVAAIDASENANPSPPAEGGETSGTYKPVRENANATMTNPELFRQPGPPPPKPNQQKVAFAPERMEVNEVELPPTVADQDLKNAEVGKPNEAAAVGCSNFMDTSEPSQKPIYDGATQGSSQKSDSDTGPFCFVPSSAQSSQASGGVGGFFADFALPPPAPQSQVKGGFFDGFFGAASLGSPKSSPDFSWI